MNIPGFSLSLFHLLVFAQGDVAAPVGGDAVGGGGAAVNPFVQMAPMLAMFVVLFYLIVMRPQQKDQQKRRELLSSLKKNDKVLTIGGIIGTIVDFSPDGARVTLKVDDGTRIRFTRSSIQGPYDEKADTETSANK